MRFIPAVSRVRIPLSLLLQILKACTGFQDFVLCRKGIITLIETVAEKQNNLSRRAVSAKEQGDIMRIRRAEKGDIAGISSL